MEYGDLSPLIKKKFYNIKSSNGEKIIVIDKLIETIEELLYNVNTMKSIISLLQNKIQIIEKNNNELNIINEIKKLNIDNENFLKIKEIIHNLIIY